MLAAGLCRSHAAPPRCQPRPRPTRLIPDHELARVRGVSTPESRRRLEHMNSVLTVVLGGHCPLGSSSWEEIEKVRTWLKNLLHEPV